MWRLVAANAGSCAACTPRPVSLLAVSPHRPPSSSSAKASSLGLPAIHGGQGSAEGAPLRPEDTVPCAFSPRKSRLGDFSQQSYQPACLFTRLLRCEKGYIAQRCAPFRALQADENPAQSGNFVSANRLIRARCRCGAGPGSGPPFPGTTRSPRAATRPKVRRNSIPASRGCNGPRPDSRRRRPI
jgi:hypothetical protein